MDNGSPKYRLSNAEVKRWIVNTLLFLAPVALLYITSVLGVLQQEGHVITLGDFGLNQFRLGVIALYVLNTVQDIIRKFIADNTDRTY